MKISRGESLDRYYLFKAFGWGIFLHKIHHSDPQGLYHSHPWNGLSLILGKYVEIKYGDRRREKWLFNLIRGSIHHRVEVSRPTWTLFIHAPRSNKWSIKDEVGNIVSEEPWRGDKGLKDYGKV